MRYLKFASDKNPDFDYIELNDFNGFLCTIFQSIGISRKLEFLQIHNRQFSVENKTAFKRYSLTIEILTRYSEYEIKHRELVDFLDRNKKSGLRLYYRPYDNMELRYCLCDIETSVRTEKRQPIVLTVTQNSLWLGELNKIETVQTEQTGNMFVFVEDSDIDDYYSASFYLDDEVSNYYCISFYSGVETSAFIVNNGYNEIPLHMMIYGYCVNPTVLLYKKGEETPIRELQIFANVANGYYIEISADITNNGIWYVNSENGAKIDYSELVNNAFGSPYFYIDNGEYYIRVTDEGNNVCLCDVYYQEEFSE